MSRWRSFCLYRPVIRRGTSFGSRHREPGIMIVGTPIEGADILVDVSPDQATRSARWAAPVPPRGKIDGPRPMAGKTPIPLLRLIPKGIDGRGGFRPSPQNLGAPGETRTPNLLVRSQILGDSRNPLISSRFLRFWPKYRVRTMCYVVHGCAIPRNRVSLVRTNRADITTTRGPP